MPRWPITTRWQPARPVSVCAGCLIRRRHSTCSRRAPSTRVGAATLRRRSAALRRPRHSLGHARRALRALLAALASLALCGSAGAHTVGISRGDYHLEGSELAAAVTFARSELALAIPALEAGQN